LGTTILYGRGDLGRTETFTETDLSISHRYKFGSDTRFSLEPYVDLRNLFDEKNVLQVQNVISSTTFTGGTGSPLVAGGCPNVTTAGGCGSEGAVFNTLFNGGIQQYVVNYLNANGVSAVGRRNDYGQPVAYQGPRDVRFGFRFLF
jgi:hypothetical protein